MKAGLGELVMFKLKVLSLKTLLMTILTVLAFSVSFAKELDMGLLNKPMPWYPESQVQQVRMALSGDVRYSQLVPLLPTQFYIRLSEGNEEYQALIDQAFLVLSQAPSMKAICHNLLNAKPELISSLYGVSAPTAQLIANDCRNFKGTLESVPSKRLFPRKYVFVFSPDAGLYLDSWTNTIANVYLFIKPQEINEQRFLRILVHELAIALDFKEQLALGARKSADAKLPEIPGFENKTYECHPSAVLRNPIVKYSFSAVRAFKFENKVMSELGFGLPVEPKKSCSQEFVDNLPFIASLTKALRIEEIFSQQVSSPNTRCERENSLSLLQKSQMLMNSKLEFSDSHTVGTCDYLVEPQLSLWTFSATEGGPRPRIGNGWGGSTGTQSGDFRQLRIESLPDKGQQFDKLLVAPVGIQEKQRILREYLKKAASDGK
jgi:hypothetical protein